MGLLHGLRKLAVLPSLMALMLVGLTLRAELPAGIALVGTSAAVFAAWHLPRTDYRLFVLHITGFLLFNAARVFADGTGNPIHFMYPIEMDRAVFGSVPTVWLQDHFYNPGHIGLLDSVTMAVYVSYFKGHFLFGAFVWLFWRRHLSTYVAVILATLGLGLIGYYLLPTAPPWLAAQQGDLAQITRIFHMATDQLWHDANSNGSYIAGTNDVAAMPSLHTGLTMAMALMAWRMNRLLGVVGFIYTAAMGFSLMYLGEHYFDDVAAGVVTAALGVVLVHKIQSRRIRVPLTILRRAANDPAMSEAA
jgi:membrane-associated phospholipid phosphatase